MEEIPTGEEVLVGTFSLNEHPVIILFDSGASHDFISSTCAKKAMLSMVATEAPYVISTPGGRWMQIGFSVKPQSSWLG
jgi:predicted aspartyl protease